MTKNKLKKWQIESKEFKQLFFVVAVIIIYVIANNVFSTVLAQNNDNEVVTSGSVDGGAYDIVYDDPEETTEYLVNVEARIVGTGEVVSNMASCSHIQEVDEFKASCAAYSSLSATVPKTFFNVGEDVYWKSSAANGEGPFDYLWGGTAITGVENNQNVGPVDYAVKGESKTASVRITDPDTSNVSTGYCSIFIRECMVDDECAEGLFCSQSSFTCELPPPVFTSPLTLTTGVANEGGTCGLSWVVDSADSCILYRNSVPMDLESLELENTTSVDMDVEPGTYTIRCENPETEFSVTGGPVRCLVNPDIREQ
ncbi:MAG: hypothetical protein WC087_01065 [Candidatus Paceibacterota bacterium]